MNKLVKLRYGLVQMTSFWTCLFRPSYRCVSSSDPLYNQRRLPKRFVSQENSELALKKDENWEVLYKLPTIKYIRLVSRVKIYQILLMGCLCYPFYVQYTDGLVTSGVFYSAVGGCIGTSMVFIVFSYFATRVVGQLAVDEEQRKLRISRLNFYGTRCDDIVPLDDVIPWTDVSAGDDLRKTFQRLHVNIGNKEHAYLYSLKYGRLVNNSLFEKVTGIS